MKFTNKNNVNRYTFACVVSLIFCVLGLVAFIMGFEFSFFKGKRYLPLLFSVGIFFLYYIRGKEIFEYDSDGEVLVFKNYGIFSFPWRKTNDEFPKYKLIDFYIVNTIFFKKLYLKIDSKKENLPILRYDITYLTTKQIQELQRSLSKILDNNNAQKHNFS